MAKYQTSVSSTAVALVESENTQTTSKNIIGSLCHTADYPINNGILRNAMESSAARLPQIHRYGRDKYTYGLPNGYMVNSNLLDTSEVEEVISKEVGYEIEVKEAFISAPEAMMFARAHATKHWGYYTEKDYMVNPPIKVDKGHQSTITDAYIQQDGSMIVTVSSGYSSRDVGYHLLTDDVYVPKNEVYGNPNNHEIYYHVSYVPKGLTNVNFSYWFYDVSLNTHTELSNIETELEQPFLPIVPLREYNKNLGPEINKEDGSFVRDENGNKITPDTELYKTSKHLLKLADLSMDELCLAVATNKDVDDIDHTYVTFAVSIRTKTKVGKHYLYQFFKQLALQGDYGSEIRIADASYDVRIRYDDISTRLIDEVLQKSYTDSNGVVKYKTEDTQLTYNGNNLTIKRMVSKTEHEEIVITNLHHVNYIFDGHAQTTTLSDSVDEDNYNFLIPLQYNLVKANRGILGRQDLLNESLVMVFNCYDRQKLKWYQTGWFKVLVIIIAVVIIVLSWGTLTEPIILAYQQGIQYLALTLAEMAIEYYVSTELIAYIAKEFGVVAAVVAAIISAVTLSGISNLKGVNSVEMFSGDWLLQMSSGFSTTVKAISKGATMNIAEEMKEFESYAEEQEDILKDLQDELYDETWIDFDLIQSREHIEFPGETPEDFYNRTIHAGNVGTLLYTAIPSYVTLKTTLPQLNKLT